MSAILNQRTRRDLEFDKVLSLVQRHAASSLGQQAVARLKPQRHQAGILAEFDRVQDCLTAIRAEGFGVGHADDIQAALNETQNATTIAPESFLLVLNTLEMIRALRERIDQLQTGNALKAMAQSLETFQTLEGFIRRSISEKGGIRDDASPQLRQLTQRFQTSESRARRKLERLLATANNLVQEPVITRRGGRFVVPIKSHLRHQLDGIVQDSSGSGQTLFFEPTSVVTDNNLMRELEGEIRDEKHRILLALTDKLREQAPKIQSSLNAYAHIDSVYARASYARHFKASIPHLNTKGLVKLKNARHPLLAPDSVVPISLSMGKQHRGIVITGPNTGGKTITLKTVGLLTLMAQSGIPIPADDGCEMSLFHQVRSDIGDEQSIEQNLSTFSSHLRNIVSILDDVDDAVTHDFATLVLLDEIGAGTDPQEGTALGVALLQAFLGRHTRLLVSTHYSALKRFAYGHPHLKNASVEFDLETLAPTYRLLEGVPGASNAFLIAKRLGLPDSLIEAATQSLSEGEVKTEDVIRELQAEHAALDQEREAFREAKLGLEAQVDHYRKRLAELERHQKRALSEESLKLADDLKQARRDLENALFTLRESKKENTLKRHHQRMVVVGEQVQTVQQSLEKPEKSAFETVDEIALNQHVRVRGFRRPAKVVDVADESRIQVELDGLRIWAKLADLAPAPDHDDQTEKTISPHTVTSPTPSPPVELDVMGMSVVDTLREVDQYLNQLLLAGREKGFILHGKGTGALRRAIRDHLRTLSWVKDHHAAAPSEGGDGVTVVQLS